MHYSQVAVQTIHSYQPPAMISIYGEVLSTIEKTLQELMEEYQGVGKFLQDLVEGQKRNMVQLERIRAVIE